MYKMCFLKTNCFLFKLLRTILKILKTGQDEIKLCIFTIQKKTALLLGTKINFISLTVVIFLNRFDIILEITVYVDFSWKDIYYFISDRCLIIFFSFILSPWAFLFLLNWYITSYNQHKSYLVFKKSFLVNSMHSVTRYKNA